MHAVSAIDIFRSEEMSHVRAIFPEELARPFLNILSNLGCVQLVDLNSELSAFQRLCTKDLARIHDLERKMTVILAHFKNYGVGWEKYDITDEKVADRQGTMDNALEGVERRINKYFTEIGDHVRVIAELQTSLAQAKEFHLVLEESGKLLKFENLARQELEEVKYEQGLDREDASSFQMRELSSEPLNLTQYPNYSANPVSLSYVAGVVSRASRPALERQLFLISRGNTLNIFSEKSLAAFDGATPEQEVFPFVVYFLGAHLRRKITRLCESLAVRIYIFPESSENLLLQLQQAQMQVDQLENIKVQSLSQLNSLLLQCSARFSSWKLFLIQEKTLAVNMNKLRVQGKTMFAHFWVPTANENEVRICLERIAKDKGLVSSFSALPTEENPPTFFRPNGFTDIFQTIVNTYGVPRYQEVNPALFTVITFPFLFGMMFGDIGHGGILLALGSVLVLYGETIRKMGRYNDIYLSVYNARYLIFFMGFFAFYMGWIYNDCFSLPIDLGTKYTWFSDQANANATRTNVNEVYLFGVDPVWAASNESLQFKNSLKMKLAVVVGVLQMTFGLVLSVFNHIHFKNYVSIYAEFIPQLVFMLSLFGYMLAMIFIKWSIDWSEFRSFETNPDGTPCQNFAPNLTTTMINMFLSMGSVKCQDILYSGQAQLQTVLVVLAGISVPWMLCLKPLILYFNLPAEQSHPEFSALSENEAESHLHAGEQDPHQKRDDHDFGEVLIHQIIHTIEYVLGTISNTASYLRLWALSLAHAELAEVFWQKVFVAAWNTKNPIIIVVGFAMWLAATIGVLMCMDVLECFLHALRLHWVEFQNKFYSADGVAFQPFSYYSSLLESEQN